MQVIHLLVITSILVTTYAVVIPKSTFLISLPRHESRRVPLIDQLNRSNQSYWLFDGADVFELTAARWAHYMKVGWISPQVFESNLVFPAAAAAASLSHLHVFLEIYDRQLDTALILEDDAWLEPDFWESLSYALEAVPDDFDLVYTGQLNVCSYCCYNDVQFISREQRAGRVLQTNGSTCNHAYIVSRKFVSRFFDSPSQLFPVDHVLDTFMFSMTRRHQLKAYILVDQLAGQQPGKNSASTIQLAHDAKVLATTAVAAEAVNVLPDITYNEATAAIRAHHARSFHEVHANYINLDGLPSPNLLPSSVRGFTAARRQVRHNILGRLEAECLELDKIATVKVVTASSYADLDQPLAAAEWLRAAGTEYRATGHLQCAQLAYEQAGMLFLHVKQFANAASVFFMGMSIDIFGFVQHTTIAFLHAGMDQQAMETVAAVVDLAVNKPTATQRQWLLTKIATELTHRYYEPHRYTEQFNAMLVCIQQVAMHETDIWTCLGVRRR